MCITVEYWHFWCINAKWTAGITKGKSDYLYAQTCWDVSADGWRWSKVQRARRDAWVCLYPKAQQRWTGEAECVRLISWSWGLGPLSAGNKRTIIISSFLICGSEKHHHHHNLTLDCWLSTCWEFELLIETSDRRSWSESKRSVILFSKSFLVFSLMKQKVGVLLF